MPNGWQKVRLIEAVSRAVNAIDWQPLPAVVKKRCAWCRYRFAVPSLRRKQHDAARIVRG